MALGVNTYIAKSQMRKFSGFIHILLNIMFKFLNDYIQPETYRHHMLHEFYSIAVRTTIPIKITTLNRYVTKVSRARDIGGTGGTCPPALTPTPQIKGHIWSSDH